MTPRILLRPWCWIFGHCIRLVSPPIAVGERVTIDVPPCRCGFVFDIEVTANLERVDP